MTKEFDNIVALSKMTSNNSITTNDDKTDKTLVDMNYQVRKRIDGVLELKVSLMKMIDFSTLGHARLRCWLSIFKDVRYSIPGFPFFKVSNEIVLKLKTKY